MRAGRRAAAALLAAAAAATTAAAARVAITSLSQPVFPGETAVIHGAGFSEACVVNFTLSSSSSGSSPPVSRLAPALAGQVADWSLKATLPAELPVGAYAVTVACPGGASAPALLNAATPWWHQGDVGAAATAGGWLRVSGAVVALLAPAEAAARLQRAIRDVRDAMTAPPMAADEAWGDASALAQHAAALLALRAQLAAATLPRVTARLTPAGGAPPVFVAADAASATAFSARFALPADLPPGEYDVAVSNGFGADSDAAAPPGAGTFVASTFFESASRPRVGSIPVQPPKAWPRGVFPVASTADPCILPCPTSDAGLQAALDAAAVAGGGTVLLARGRFYLTRPVVLPPNTLLAGAEDGGASATSVWFTEWATPAAAPVALFLMNATLAARGAAAPALGAAPAGSGLASWGLANFTLYVTGAVNNVVYVCNRTDGFVLQGARFRVNPYAFTWGPWGPSRGRVMNETVLAFGNVIDLHGVNHRITANDVWGMGILINSFSSVGNPPGSNNWPNYRRGHEYSYIADNTLWGGQATHFMQLWRQVIFERNVIFGATEAAGGQSLGTGPMGGMAQHVLHADNVVRFTWGGDREVMTYDDAGGAYYGALAAVDGATLTLAADAWPASDWEMGGWLGGQVYVVNGTGATQIRRVLLPGVNVTASPSNRTWVLSEPFAVDPDVGPGGSTVQIMPFRGRNIFHRDLNVDTGPHQFYGHAVESIVSDTIFERVRGLIGWGQWRGWVPPPPVGDGGFWSADGGWPPAAGGAARLGGLMGNGLQPNVRNAYRGNVFTEREHLVNYACNQSGYVEFWGGKSHVLYPAGALNATAPGTPHPVHVGLTYRGETTPGGFLLGGDDADVLIEGATVTAAEGACFDVSARAALVLVTNSSCALAP